jgi:hypothetical protein
MLGETALFSAPDRAGLKGASWNRLPGMSLFSTEKSIRMLNEVNRLFPSEKMHVHPEKPGIV